MSNHESITLTCVNCGKSHLVLEDEPTALCIDCIVLYEETTNKLVDKVVAVSKAESAVRDAVEVQERHAAKVGFGRQYSDLLLSAALQHEAAEDKLVELYDQLAKLEDTVWEIDNKIEGAKQLQRMKAREDQD